MNITYFSFINTKSLKLPEDFVGLDFKWNISKFPQKRQNVHL